MTFERLNKSILNLARDLQVVSSRDVCILNKRSSYIKGTCTTSSLSSAWTCRSQRSNWQIRVLMSSAQPCGSPLVRTSWNLVWASKIWEPLATGLLAIEGGLGDSILIKRIQPVWFKLIPKKKWKKKIIWYKLGNRNIGLERRSMLGHQMTAFGCIF